MTFKQGFIEKLAYTAMDKFQGIWRANGGFAKQIAPYLNAATPGLTPKIEQSVFQRVGSNPSLTQKYKQLLESRMRTTPSLKDVVQGKNLSKGGTDVLKETLNTPVSYTENYANRGKVVKDLDFDKKVDGVWDNIIRKITPAIQKGELEIIGDASTHGASVAKSFNASTGKVTNNNTDNPIKMHLFDSSKDSIKGTNIPHEYSGYQNTMVNDHESNEFTAIPKRSGIKIKRLNKGIVEDMYVDPGIGSHLSHSVLMNEQVALRHMPDSVYNHYMNLRVHGHANSAIDSEKLEMLKQHGANFKPYGTDLRYRPKEVKSVDNASDAGLKQTYDELLEHSKDFHEKVIKRVYSTRTPPAIEDVITHAKKLETSIKNNYPMHGNIADYSKHVY